MRLTVEEIGAPQRRAVGTPILDRDPVEAGPGILNASRREDVAGDIRGQGRAGRSERRRDVDRPPELRTVRAGILDGRHPAVGRTGDDEVGADTDGAPGVAVRVLADGPPPER